MKIYHAADIHLGKRRLDGRLPDQDFADAFGYIARAAIKDSADVFILAGDLFDRPQVEPGHLRQAQEILQTLYAAKIPVIAIEGNHDKASIQSEDPTWISFLAQDGLVSLLRPQFNSEGAVLAAFDLTRQRGSVIEYQGIRFVGAGYLGAATPAKVRQIATALPSDSTNVLILHAGPDYFVGEGGGFSQDDLSLIRDKVAYLALGHIHKPMLNQAWACNPGSPENCDLREAAYCKGKDGAPIARGFAVVTLDAQNSASPPKIEIRSNPRRPVHRLDLDCTPFGNKTKGGSAAFVQAACKRIRSVETSPDAVIDLRLTGTMNLNRIALDHQEVCSEICREAHVFAVSLDAGHLNVGIIAGGALEAGKIISRDDLEKEAIRKIVADEPLCADKAEEFASLFYMIKEAVRNGSEPTAIAELISTSPLVESVREAKETLLAERSVTPAPAASETEVGI